MEVAVSPFLLGWAVMGFGVIGWFILRRRRAGPLTRGVVLGYSALLGGSAGVVALVLSDQTPIAIVTALVVGVAAYLWLMRA